MRLLLSWWQCDGEHPICGRCEGYGHICTWSKDKKDPTHTATSDTLSPSDLVSGTPQLLQSAVQSYENLIASVRSHLPESARNSLNATLSQIRSRLPADCISLASPAESPTATAIASFRHEPSDQCGKTPRYLGEASDVRFFHTVKKILRDDVQSGGPVEDETQSYDQGVLHLETHDSRQHLPTKEKADSYIEIYFFTIHIAYPFLSKSSFMARYEDFWKEDIQVDEGPSWLPLLCKSLLTLEATALMLMYLIRHYFRYRLLLHILPPR